MSDVRDDSGWQPYRGGETIGERGSEDGVIVRDEEHPLGARATLETLPSHCAITCGVYGAMVHTVFLASAGAEERYQALLDELAALVAAAEPDFDEFVARW